MEEARLPRACPTLSVGEFCTMKAPNVAAGAVFLHPPVLFDIVVKESRRPVNWTLVLIESGSEIGSGSSSHVRGGHHR